MSPARLAALLVAAAAALAALAPVATGGVDGADYVHAHRGGPLVTVKGKQRPAFGEETMPAFRDSAERGFVLELDAKLSSDGVPMVIHDATLDRTTACDGAVAARTATEIRRDCPVDTIGTADLLRQLPPDSDRTSRVPTLRRILRLADRRGGALNLEIKNQPTDPDFDATDGFAQTVADVVRRSGFPPSRLIVQSFWPPNLDVIERDPYFDRAETSLLTLASFNESGPASAEAAGYEWVSPEWPVDEAYVRDAHGRGLRVVPFTLDRRRDVVDATEVGVDAVISNDPRMARRASR